MIISHAHRYLFIEIPLTASWATRYELCAFYGGEPMLHKHAAYREFAAQATADEQTYFVFAAVRNPLDAAVSGYFKLLSDHKGHFSGQDSVKSGQADYRDLAKYRWIQQRSATFADYFRRYQNRPYVDMIERSRRRLDFVIRYENLQADFAAALGHVGLEPVRPIPRLAATAGKDRPWLAYYTPDLVPQAKRQFGPAMRSWGYAFPAEWGPHHVSPAAALQFHLLRQLQAIYLDHFRYRSGRAAAAVRRLRALLQR
jgi:hypothetical protein